MSIRIKSGLGPVLVLAACASEPTTPTPPPYVPASVARELAAAEEAAEPEPAIALTADASLDDCLRLALATSPALRAAQQRWLAATERPAQVAALPDPVLSARYYVEEVQTRTGPQEWAVGLRQTLPWFGKRARRREAAGAQADAERARYEEAALAVVTEVRLAWYELFFLERSIATVTENLSLLQRVEEVVRTRYAAGEAGYADLVRVQVERDRLDDRLRGLEDRRRPAGARLNAALHRPVGAPVPRPAVLPEREALVGDQELRQALEESSPELAVLRQQIVAAERGVELARLQRRPDVTVGIEYIGTGSAKASGTSGSGDDPILATLSFGLPLASRRYHAAEREARARMRATLEELDASRDRLHRTLEEELFAVRDADRRVALYRDALVPHARQAFAAVETAFRSGETGFLDLVDSERALLEFELMLERARTDRAGAIARLEQHVGAPVTRTDAAEEDTP